MSDITFSAPPSLRDRQAAQLRAEIAQVAISQFLRSGFEATTIDEIARDCGVSRRTVFRHFSTKENILLVWPIEAADELAQMIAGRDEAEDALTCLQRALIAFVASRVEGLPDLLPLARLIQCTAGLRSRIHEVVEAWERALVDGLVTRRSQDAALAPVAVAVALAVARLAAQRWLKEGGPRSLSVVIEEAFQELPLIIPSNCPRNTER